jgi:hypothetical protein
MMIKINSMSGKKQIRDLASLDREIISLKRKALKIQHQMDQQVLHLKEHSGSMFWNSIMGQSSGRNPIMAAVVGAILQNEKVQGLIKKLTGKLADFITKASDSVFMQESDAGEGAEN